MGHKCTKTKVELKCMAGAERMSAEEIKSYLGMFARIRPGDDVYEGLEWYVETADAMEYLENAYMGSIRRADAVLRKKLQFGKHKEWEELKSANLKYHGKALSDEDIDNLKKSVAAANCAPATLDERIRRAREFMDICTKEANDRLQFIRAAKDIDDICHMLRELDSMMHDYLHGGTVCDYIVVLAAQMKKMIENEYRVL